MAQDLDMLLASGKGAMSGAGMGASLGSNPALLAATGGLSVPIGAATGALVGGGAAAMKQKKADDAQKIPFVDPLEAKRLAEIEQARRSIMTGSDAITQRRIDEARNVGSAVQGAISRNTGGDVASTMDALLKAQKNTQASVNQGISEGQQRLPYFDNASTMLAQRIAQRKADLAKINRDQALAENTRARTVANLNTDALIGTQGGTGTPQDALNYLIEMIKNNQGIVSQDQTVNYESSLGVTPGDVEIGTNNFMNFLGGLQSSGLIQ